MERYFRSSHHFLLAYFCFRSERCISQSFAVRGIRSFLRCGWMWHACRSDPQWVCECSLWLACFLPNRRSFGLFRRFPSFLYCLWLQLAHRLVIKFPDNGEADGVPKDLPVTPLQSSQSLRKTQSAFSLKPSQSSQSLKPSKSTHTLSTYALNPSKSTHALNPSKSTHALSISHSTYSLIPSQSTLSPSALPHSGFAGSAGFSPLEESDVEMAMELEAETLPMRAPILRSILAVPSNWLRPIRFLLSWNSIPARAARNDSVGRLFDLSAQHSLRGGSLLHRSSFHVSTF